MKNLFCTTALALALGLTPALAQAPAGTPAAGTAASTAAELSQHDRDFVQKAAQGGMAEVELGRLASERAASADVKQFGQQMVDDHSRANEQLKELASQKGIQVPTELDAEHRQKRERMAGLEGDQFDRQYMQATVQDHRQTIDLFRGQVAQGQDADLKQFAQTTLPTLQAHLDRAQQIQLGLQPVASAAPAGTDAAAGTVVTPRPAAGAPAAAVPPPPGMDTRLAQMTAKDLIGKDVVNAGGKELGEIKDVVVGTDRTVHVVVGYGGFLGFGQKQVVVPLRELRVGDADAIMMSEASDDALTQFPAYEKSGFEDWPRDRRLAE